ncbi:MAG: SRPBCC family protein, partial [Actinomycetota bacterium]
MATIRSTTRIDAPPEAVFDFIDHWPNAKRYMRRMIRYDIVDPEGGTGVGAEFLIAVEAAGTRLNGHIRVTEHDRPSTIAFKTIEGVRVEGSWALTPEGDGTRVVLDSVYEPPGGIIGRVVATFIKANAQGDLDSSLR